MDLVVVITPFFLFKNKPPQKKKNKTLKTNKKLKKQFLTMDILVLATMKNAAKCDT